MFDRPLDPDNQHDSHRVYTTLLNARNDRDAIKKAIAGRREAQPEKRIYDYNVVGSVAQRYPG
ncbi:MAG: hypothetical protein ABII79_09490 [bacterium]